MRPGFICIKISGEDVAKTFEHEAGGHRWQRIPPTEKRGRVQTSTITVAVLSPSRILSCRVIPEQDLEIKTTRGSGNGGQHRNKTESAVQIKHLPTGIIVRCESERSQYQNKSQAMEVLGQKLHRLESTRVTSGINEKRRDQLGNGLRGNKIRTIRVRDDMVTNHANGKKTSFRRYSQGFIEDLA
jgi:peptide chain release factor 1